MEESRVAAPNGRIRVASVLECLAIGGDENRLLAFARTLDRSRFDHLVVAFRPVDEGNPQMQLLLEWLRETGSEILVLGLDTRSLRHAPEQAGLRRWTAPARDAATYVDLVRRLARLFRERRIDLVDARLEMGTIFGTIAARLAGVPAVVSTAYTPRAWSGPFRYVLGQAIYTQVDALVSDAEATIGDYRKWLLRRDLTMACIRNGIYPAVGSGDAHSVRRALGVPDEPGVCVIGQVSRIIPRKALEILLQAARIVLDDHPGSFFVLCGFGADSPYGESLRAMARTLAIEDRVRICSYPGPIAEMLGALDIFVHASRADSSPIAIHESMSAGLPAVVSHVGGTAELVADGVSGLIVPPDDPQALAAALIRLIGDPGLRERLGRAARERYAAHHRPERMARETERLFESLVAARPR